MAATDQTASPRCGALQSADDPAGLRAWVSTRPVPDDARAKAERHGTLATVVLVATGGINTAAA